MRVQTEAVKSWIREADREYREKMEATTGSSQLRTFEIGDQVSLKRTDLAKKDKNAGACTWDGPWEVIQLGNMPTEFMIKRLGSRQKPKWAHVNDLKKQHKEQDDQSLREVEPEQAMKEAPTSAGSYEVEEIVGEAGRSRATKHYLVKYQGFEEAWWQPQKNLHVLSRQDERLGHAHNSREDEEASGSVSSKSRGHMLNHGSAAGEAGRTKRAHSNHL